MENLEFNQLHERIQTSINEHLNWKGGTILNEIHSASALGPDESGFFYLIWEECNMPSSETQEDAYCDLSSKITDILHESFRDAIPDHWILVGGNGLFQEWKSPNNDWAKIQFSDSRVYLWFFYSGQY